jgi:hypothetical protein
MVKKKTKLRKITIYRSSVTGRFVRKKYAKQKPKTTTKEIMKISQ